MIRLAKQFQSWGSSLYEVSIASLDTRYVVNSRLTTIELFATRVPKKKMETVTQREETRRFNSLLQFLLFPRFHILSPGTVVLGLSDNFMSRTIL